jgi:hypothetical protein
MSVGLQSDEPGCGAGVHRESIQLDTVPSEQASPDPDGAAAKLGTLSLAEPRGTSAVAATAGDIRLPRRSSSRRLLPVPSRGSSLSSLGDAASGNLSSYGAPTQPQVALGADHASDRSSGSSSGLPEVVLDNPCHWLFFRGDWGTTPAPICQSWMHRAEPPLSRTPLLRLFGHFVAEPD